MEGLPRVPLLTGPLEKVRLDALEALIITSTKGVPEAVKTVAIAMKDANRDVRLAAVTAMPQVHESAIRSFAPHMGVDGCLGIDVHLLFFLQGPSVFASRASWPNLCICR